MRDKIKIEVSARHIHLSRKDVNKLFGKDYQLTPIKWLSQPGQFLARERVNIKGPKGELNDVAILGPLREKTQLELSTTDTFCLGTNYETGEDVGIQITDEIKIYTEQAEILLRDGAIVPLRHIHVSPEQAEKYGLENTQLVNVKVSQIKGRGLVFLDVVVRIDENYSYIMHIDTDEANAAAIIGFAEGEIV